MDWITTTRFLDDLGASDNNEAWERFYNHFQPPIVRFACKLGLEHNYAEDVASETLMTFLKKYRQDDYDRSKGRLSKWLFGICHNIILNFKRKMPREKLISDRTTEADFWAIIEDEKAVRHTWNTELRPMVLQCCLDEIRLAVSEQTYKAFEFYCLKEKPVDEVAEPLGMSRNAVYLAKNRVLSRLEKMTKEFEL